MAALLTIIEAGLQTTVQAAPRLGYRHRGVPWAGPADDLSFAIANHLVGNAPGEAGLEITMGGFVAGFEADAVFALTGAPGEATLNGEAVPHHQTHTAHAGDVLKLAPPKIGMRSYLAFGGRLAADEILGSMATYLPAGLGGFSGRALAAGDVLHLANGSDSFAQRETPRALRPYIDHHWTARCLFGPEADLLTPADRAALQQHPFTIGRRGNRMGVALEGHVFRPQSAGTMRSSPVFPGTIQCPEGGVPFLLMADAQTTGGYPRIAQVIRADRHRLGQMRPGDTLSLAMVEPEFGQGAMRTKAEAVALWMSETLEAVD